MPIQKEFICGLSHEVTIAVLPRLNMEELMFELNRRIKELDKENSIKARLVSILRDVMLEEYRQWERRSQVSSPDEMQENALTAYTETMLSEISSPDASRQSSGLDIVIKKESDRISEMLVYTKEPEFNTERLHLTVPQQDQLCNIPSPLTVTGSPTIPSCETPLTQMYTTTNSSIKEKDVAMPTEDEAVIACHDVLNIHTPISSTQEPDTLNLMNTSTSSRTENPVESDTPTTSCHLPPDHGDVHIKTEGLVSQDDQNGQISQPSNPDQTEHYTDDRDTGIINNGHKQSRKDSSEETPLASCEPTPYEDCETMSSLVPQDASRIHVDAKRYVCDVVSGFKTSFAHSFSKHRKCHKAKGEKPFMCRECGYRSCKKSRLVEHMRTHTGKKPFKCDQCNYETSFKGNLVLHMKKHTSAEPYSCKICDYKTYRKFDLEKHVRRHNGIKPYKCEECDYSTVQKSHLIKHRRCHTGERPYTCPECDYKAKVKVQLNRHMRCKHP